MLTLAKNVPGSQEVVATGNEVLSHFRVYCITRQSEKGSGGLPVVVVETHTFLVPQTWQVMQYTKTCGNETSLLALIQTFIVHKDLKS